MNYKAIFLKALPHILAVLVMTAASVAYFYPQLEGKVMQMDDVMAGQQAAGEVKEYAAKTGKTYLWSNGQFVGMPKMVWVAMKYNHILKIYDVFKLGFDEPIGMYLAIMIFAYALFFFLGAHPIICVALAIATSLNTSSVILWNAGHYSKIATLAFTPLILLSAMMIFEKKNYKWGFLILTFALAGSLTTQHPQMTYYIMLFFAIFGGVYLYDSYKKGTVKEFTKSSGIAILAGILAFSITSTRMLSLYDFSKQTIRGESILSFENVSNDGTKEGLDWEYSTQWSNDTKDLVASFLIPGFVGGGGGERVGVKSESFKKFRIKQAPLYWGNLPFTVGPMYIGVSLTYLFFLGLFVVKGRKKWWLGIGVILLSLFSMGKNFEIINKLLFDFLPMYDKFRAPQSILNTVIFYVPMLAALCIASISKPIQVVTKSKRKLKEITANNISLNRYLLILTSIFSLFLLIIAVLGSGMFSFESTSDQRYIQQGVDVSVFIKDRMALMRSDAFRSLIIVLVLGSIIWVYINKKISVFVLFSVIALTIIIDMWGVSKRYISHDSFVVKSKISESINTPREVDQRILDLEDNRHGYRVQDLSVNTYMTSSTSFFHNTIGGLDPAKLRRFQDILERQLYEGNMQVYNMLNTKYFIVKGQNGKPELNINSGALGNAWYIKNIEWVSNPEEEISALSKFDLSSTAVILRPEFQSNMSTTQNFELGGEISLVDYEPSKLTYMTNRESAGLALFSEVWYNGNRDWKSYIDGKPVDHFRANYLLRGIEVPAGKHEIVFEFRPVVYSIGEKLSLVGFIIFCSIFLILSVIEIRKFVS